MKYDNRTIRIKWEAVITFNDPVNLPDPQPLYDNFSQIAVDLIGGEGKGAYLHPGSKISIGRTTPPKPRAKVAPKGRAKKQKA